jgi:RNA recognition motif-containing protein
MRLYVGNLPFTTTESELRTLFEGFGEVTKVTLVIDRESNRPRGFGFVDLADADAAAAITALDGKPLENRNLRVAPASPRRDAA